MKIYIYLSFVAVLLIGTFGCSDDKIKNVTPPVEDTSGFYVLCEGLVSTNVSTLGFYCNKNKSFDKDYFQTINKRILGSMANDIKLYGSKIWIVMNVSNRIEVIDAATGVSLKQIDLKATVNDNPKPRYITFYNNKAYVCCFDGTVSKIDTATYAIDAMINVGNNPDGICTANGKLYVSNSGGSMYPIYDKYVTVVDINTFTEIKKIEVGVYPGKLMSDKNGNVYVQVRGDYASKLPSFKKIDSKTDAITKVWNLDVTNYTIDDASLYFYTYNYKTLQSVVKTINLNDESIANENLLAEISKVTHPYGIAVHKQTKDIYITDTIDFLTTGNLYVFDSKGKFKSELKDVGCLPDAVLFLY